MPNPLFQSVIGNGFDADSAQQSGWANFNRGVEEANMGRLAAAQQTRNNWLAQVQQINQQQADREDRAQQEADAEALSQQRAAEQRRQFDVGTSLTREQMKAQVDARKLALQQDYQTVGNAAGALAPYAHEYSSAVEGSQKALEEATKNMDTQAADAQASAPAGKVIYNTRAKMFMPADAYRSDPEAQSAASAANTKVSTAKAAYDTAAQEFKFHSSRLSDLQKRADKFGLIVSKKGDKWVLVDSATGRAFESPDKPATKVTAASDEANPPSMWFGGIPMTGTTVAEDGSPMTASPIFSGAAPAVRRRYNPDTGLIE